MWQGASEAKIAATRAYGATVDLEAHDPARRSSGCTGCARETGRVFVHPSTTRS
jgi:threonine dehydratase